MLRGMRSPLILVLLASGCVSVLPPDDTAGSTSSGGGGESTSTATTVSGGDNSSSSTAPDDDSSSTSSSTSSSSSSSSTGREPLCDDGVIDSGEACDDGVETKLCDSDCTPAVCGDARVNAAAGEECDDGNVDDTDACMSDCTAAVCGDGALHVGVEECDDGNLVEGDGCDATCARERWAHVGVAHDVPVADLYKWEPEPCWVDTYEAGDLVDDLPAACEGDHLLMACRPAGADTLTLAAHGPREAVLLEVNYPAQERSSANGVDFYWSPWHGVIGFGPEGESDCSTNADNACWLVGGNMPMKFTAGYRCGGVSDMSVAETKTWERVVFAAWD